MRRVGLLAGALWLAFAGSAAAADLPQVDGYYYGDGNPVIDVVVPPGQGGTVELRRCTDAASPCTPVASGASVHYVPGETAAGTVFEAAWTKPDATIVTRRLTPWLGHVAPTGVPSITGNLVVGGIAQVAGTSWNGGWGPGVNGVPDGSSYQIFACPGPGTGQCWQLAYSGSVVIAPQFAGYYLIAAEARGAARLIPPPMPAYRPTPFMTAVSAPANGVLSPPAGPIAAPPVKTITSVDPVDPAYAPKASIRARALRSHGRLLVGRVSCPLRCTVKLTVGKLHRTLTVIGVKALTVPVRHGKLKVSVVVDGKVLAARKTVAR